MAINSVEEFKKLVVEITAQDGYREPIAFGIARVDRGQKNADKILQANFPLINWRENYSLGAIFIKALQDANYTIDFRASEFIATINDKFLDSAMVLLTPYLGVAMGDEYKNIQIIKSLTAMEDIGKNFRIVLLFDEIAPKSVEAVYLKLYALSLQKAPLRSLNLDGAFGLLTNVAWVGNRPYELEYLRENELEMKLNGTFPNIDSIDKFPRYLQHIIPADNTRVLDSSRVRMGACLAGGTTVMPGASYINFNAGTLGAVMVEGRISSSAIVGQGSDIGGGASILGVLSGTDGNPISIGENSLLGANSVTGIPLGDGCIVDAGVTILAGTKVKIEPKELKLIQGANPDRTIREKEIFKGKELQGLNGIHYRQNSITGEIVAKRSTREIKLNQELH